VVDFQVLVANYPLFELCALGAMEWPDEAERGILDKPFHMVHVRTYSDSPHDKNVRCLVNCHTQTNHNAYAWRGVGTDGWLNSDTLFFLENDSDLPTSNDYVFLNICIRDGAAYIYTSIYIYVQSALSSPITRACGACSIQSHGSQEVGNFYFVTLRIYVLYTDIYVHIDPPR
jgi:hypothetical protein